MNLITKGQNIHIIIFFITLLFSQIHDQVICQHFCDRLVAHTEQDGPVELNQDSPKFLLKKSMINVFSHLPQQVAFWKGLSRGFLHEKKKKNHRARQIHKCLLAPGKPSRLEICQRACFGILPVFCSGETLRGGTSFALVKSY